jgi:chemotaxis protein MotA
MDFGTVIGGVVAAALLVAAILLGGTLIMFWDTPSVVVVVGCGIAALFIAYPAGLLMETLKALKFMFLPPKVDLKKTMALLSELSNRARREGLLSLEAAAQQAEDPFLKRGLLMMADGHEAGTIESVLFDEIGKIDERHRAVIGVVDAAGAYGPAMGMLGTLIGLVLMLADLDDPSTLGPKMAIALLTTFYGSIIANLMCIPASAKLKARSADEIFHKEMIAAGLLSILAGENPRFMIERLNAQLAPKQRYEEAA